MRRNSSEFNTGFISEAGTFRTNKDYFAFMELDDMACWIAADGIDSDEDIESAEIAVKSIFADFSEKPVMSRRRIKKYLKNAHKTLKSESRSVRLKASVTVVITDYSKMVWATAGNVRMYHFRKGKFNFRSKDQSIAQMMADAGKINEYEINGHEERNNLTNYLGKAEGFKPYISKKYRLYDGDVLILCTPGFWENMDNVEMVDALSEAQNPEELVDNLEELLLGKQNRVLNNYTIAAVYANKVFKESPKNNMRWVKRVAAILIPILIACAGLFIYKKIDEAKTRELLEESITSGDKLAGEKKYDDAIEKYDAAINYSKKLKDLEKENNVESKKKIVQEEKLNESITRGDEQFNDKKYDEALKNYDTAIKYSEILGKRDTKKELESKKEITDLVIKGDELFKDKKYENAKSTYISAWEKAKQIKSFDTVQFKDKTDELSSLIELNKLIKQGKEEVGYKNFDKALSKYKEALDIANSVPVNEQIQMLNEEIEKVENIITMIDEDNPERKIKQVKDWEEKGDKRKKDKEYDSAIEYYKLAQDICKKMDQKESKNFNFIDKYDALEDKILECVKERATATPLPAPAVIETPTAVKQ